MDFPTRKAAIMKYGLLAGRFSIVYKLGSAIHVKAFEGGLWPEVQRISRLPGFRFANVYDRRNGWQLLSYTNLGVFRWFVDVEER